MVGSSTVNSNSTRKAINALLPYAIFLEQSGDQKMLDVILRVARSSGPQIFLLHYIGTNLVILLRGPTPPSLNRATILLSLYVPWQYWDKSLVSGWAAAARAVLYSDEVGICVVEMLLRLASSDTRRPYIPNDIWVWLKRRPSLPPVCEGRYRGTEPRLIRHVRGIGDLDILTSYFLLVWSEWNPLRNSGFSKMQASIVEDLSGIEMQHYREDLVKRLDHILGEVDRGLEHFKQREPRIEDRDLQMRKGQYRTLREVLLKVERETTKSLTSMCQVDPFRQAR